MSRSITTRRRRPPSSTKKGDVKAAFAGAAKTYKAEFRSDYGYHAQMEPLNAVVRINDDGDRRGLGRQPGARRDARRGGQGARPQAQNRSTMHQCYMGGGFGRRSLGDYAAECARIAKEVAPAGQADLDARGGHRPRHVPPAVVPVPGGGDRRERQGRPAGSTASSATAECCCITGIKPPTTTSPTSTSSGAGCRTASGSSTGGRSATCSTRSRSKAWSTRWRRTPAWTRSSSASSACRSPRRRRNASRPCATDVRLARQAAGRPRARRLGHRALGLARRRRGRDLARPRRPARSASTRCGPRSTAASSSRRALPRPMWRAPSCTGSPASCTSA